MSGPEQVGWPDGKSLMDQLAIVVNVFDLIDEQVALEAKSEQLKNEAIKNVS